MSVKKGITVGKKIRHSEHVNGSVEAVRTELVNTTVQWHSTVPHSR